MVGEFFVPCLERISAGLSMVHSIIHDFIFQPPKFGCKPVIDLSIVA
jgi:hypothetical protein